MDFSKIKKLVQQNGDKFIVLENGEPELVILSFEEYERLLGIQQALKKEVSQPIYYMPPVSRSEQAEESRPLDFADLDSNRLEETEFETMAAETARLPLRLEDIRIEDLPI